MFQAQLISSHYEPSMYQDSQVISLSCFFHTNHFITISCETHVNPLFTIHDLHHSIILIHIKPSAQYSKPSKHHPYKAKKTISHCTASPSTSLRLGGLAQARHARSGEPPSPRRGLERASGKPRGISLRRDPSRLGEILARSKFMSGSPGRPLA